MMTLLPTLFNPAFYAYSFAAWPPAIVGTAVIVLAGVAFLRERGSDVSMAFLWLSISVFIWLASFGAIYSTTNVALAVRWSHLEVIGVVFIPTLLFRFTLIILKRLQKYRAWSQLTLAVSTLFALLAFFGSSFVTGVQLYAWGFYPLYGKISRPFLLLTLGCVGGSLFLLWKSYRELPVGQRRTMLRSFFLALSIGSLGLVDLLASYGVTVYPIGYLPVYTCLLMLAQTIWRYNLADITPSIAAPQILETLPSAIIVTDPDGIISLVNPKAVEILERPEKDLIGSQANKIMPSLLTAAHLEILQVKGTLPDYDVTLVSSTGEKRYLIFSISAARDTNGRLLGYVCGVRNITPRRVAEDALRESEARFHRLFDSNIIGFMRVNHAGTVLEANGAFLRMMGYHREDLLAGTIGGSCMTPPEHQTLDLWMAERLKETGLCPPVEKEYIRKDGSRLTVLVGVMRLSDGEGDLCFVIDATDRRQALDALRKAYDEMELRVSERTAELSQANEILGREVEQRKRAESALRSLSITDALTGLYNRRGFLTLAAQLLKQALRDECAFLLFMADLDGLKEINDTYGHFEGDQAINAVAAILRDIFRASDVVSRLGGDEFAIAVMDDSDDSHADVLLQRLSRRLEEWNTKTDKPYILSFSIGAARRDIKEDISVETLLQRADSHLYEQKRMKHAGDDSSLTEGKVHRPHQQRKRN